MATMQSDEEAPASSRDWRLPALRGKWLTLYVILWVIALPLALVGPINGLRVYWQPDSAWPAYGFWPSPDRNGIHVNAVWSEQARAAGVVVDDYVVGIDGWTVPDGAAGWEAATSRLAGPENAATIFTLREAGSGAFRSVRLNRSLANRDLPYEAAGVSRTVAWLALVGCGAAVPLVLVAAAILLFLRRRGEAVPALLSLGFLLMSAFNFAANWDNLGLSRGIADRVGDAAWPIMLAALFAFPSGRFVPRWTAVPAALTPLMAVQSLLQGPSSGSLFLTNLVLAIFCLLALAALAARYRRIPAGVERQQLRWVFLGFVCGMLLLAGASVGIGAQSALASRDPRWEIWMFVTFYPMGTTGMICIALGLIVSVLRYRLYDADAVISRSVTFGALTLLLLGIFAGSEKIIELFGERYFGEELGMLAGGIGAALAAVMIGPLHHRVSHWAEHRFQKQLIKLRRGLPLLVGDLRETAGLEGVAAAVLDAVRSGVRARHAALLVGGALADARGIPAEEVEAWRSGWTPAVNGGLDCDRADRLFPMRVSLEAGGHGHVGWLLLGPRPDGSFYGKDEQAALSDIADPVARALRIAGAREAGERQRQDREGAQQVVLTALSERLAAVEAALARWISAAPQALE
jgi:hypothetical protein